MSEGLNNHISREGLPVVEDTDYLANGDVLEGSDRWVVQDRMRNAIGIGNMIA